MRRVAILSVSLLVAGCAGGSKPVPVAEAPPSVHTRGGIVGMTTDELVRQLGTPALQVREGTSLKLQFRSRECVLDAYLYPSGEIYRVSYVDTRNRAMADVDQSLCVASLRAP